MPYTLLEMSDSLQDALGVLLEDHVPVGLIPFAWEHRAGAASAQFDASNRLARLNIAFGGITWYSASVQPSVDNYRQKLIARVPASDTSAAPGGILARIQGIVNLSAVRFTMACSAFTPTFDLTAFNNLSVSFATDSIPVPAELFDTDVELELISEGNIHTGYANGVQVCQIVDVGNLLPSGKVGIYCDYRIDRTPRLKGPWELYTFVEDVVECFPDTTTVTADPEDAVMSCLADPAAMELDDSCIPEAI